jgi:plastocyanin domain-containing protein
MHLARHLLVPALLLGLAWTAPATAAPKEQTVQMEVTKDGFVPSEVTVKKGQPVKLVVTRKVERTCATEIVIKELGVNQPLPLDKAVAVTVKADKPGTYTYSCAMGHISGKLKVE